ncbi:hypothetical protein B8T99_09665 [Vibrio cholerae]|uniref:Uncharacterized protein n=1 Tax=Vibrio cholerae TaxID=666 RepID=A0A2V4NDD7_VIBCL|nr:hypothetical protein A6J62_11050 [Vibrio cholerae]AVH51436.1 hypothetical protein C4E16_03535 [Vibrio cholerae O1 biovar El Tor]OWH63060.1 hypothetical protein CBG28_07115 [Vibrio cholerae O139]ATQ46298.1 hypothetical protein CSW01_06255 [Vibrio cholerae]AUR69446.1 hypothetical protein C1H56_04955 [Vibrio cholerae]
MLATFVHPNHIVCLCSWGFTYLPPTCNSKLFGYKLMPSGLCSAGLMGISFSMELGQCKRYALAFFIGRFIRLWFR